MKTVLLGLALSTLVFAQKSNGAAVRVREYERVTIAVRSDEEAILNKTNLDRIKKFIPSNGATCTYCQMYNNNPCFQKENFFFYLNPDPGGPCHHPQFNINCDPKVGDFNTLAIWRKSTKDASAAHFRDQCRDVDFQQESIIKLEASYIDPEMRVWEIRAFPEQAVKELLAVIEQRKKLAKTAR